MNKLKYIGLAVLVLLVGWGVWSLKSTQNPLKGISSQSTPYLVATDASTTCGQYTQGTITVGPTAASTSTTTGTFVLTINGVTTTSASENTSTVATTVATAIATAINAASTTLGMSAAATSNVVNTTSSAWGAFQTITGLASQNGLTLSTTTAGPATAFLASIGNTNGGHGRLDFEASNVATSAIYLCHNSADCTTGVGVDLPQVASNSLSYYSESNNYWGGYACIGNVSGTTLSYTYSQY